MNNSEIKQFIVFSKSMKAKTKDSYMYVLSELKDFTNKDLIDINSEDIKKYIEHLNNEKQAKTTIRRKYHQLFSYYNFLEGEFVIKQNPLKAVPTPKASKQIKMERTLTFENLEVLLNTLKEHFPYRDYVFTLLLATTGLKLSEALNIKWTDFFIDNNNYIGIRIGNKNNPRYVRIFDFVWEEINQYREDYLKVDESYLNEDYYVFIGEKQLNNYRAYPGNVKPITGDWIRKTYVNACETAQIPLVTAKDIRHTYTMLTMKLGAREGEIQEQLGWSSTQFIERYHGVVEQLNSPINKYVEEYFEKIKS